MRTCVNNAHKSAHAATLAFASFACTGKLNWCRLACSPDTCMHAWTPACMHGHQSLRAACKIPTSLFCCRTAFASTQLLVWSRARSLRCMCAAHALHSVLAVFSFSFGCSVTRPRETVWSYYSEWWGAFWSSPGTRRILFCRRRWCPPPRRCCRSRRASCRR